MERGSCAATSGGPVSHFTAGAASALLFLGRFFASILRCFCSFFRALFDISSPVSGSTQVDRRLSHATNDGRRAGRGGVLESTRAGRAASAIKSAMLWRMGLCRLLRSAAAACVLRRVWSTCNLPGEARRDRACADLLKRVTRLHPTVPACPACASSAVATDCRCSSASPQRANRKRACD